MKFLTLKTPLPMNRWQTKYALRAVASTVPVEDVNNLSINASENHGNFNMAISLLVARFQKCQ
jgi:hypothetical protein